MDSNWLSAYCCPILISYYQRVRNRITSLGTPTETVPDYLTAAQVRALFAAGRECEFSEDGENWHGVQTANDNYLHMRLRGESLGVWSDPIVLMTGPRGYTGRDCFCYVASASSATGANFSLEPANHLNYRAEIHTDTAIAEPTAADFADARWIKYIGDPRVPRLLPGTLGNFPGCL